MTGLTVQQACAARTCVVVRVGGAADPLQTGVQAVAQRAGLVGGAADSFRNAMAATEVVI